MEQKHFDVFGIGSALMDIIIEVDHSALIDFQLNKGEMHLIGYNKSKHILEKINHLPKEHYPGGSASNTLAGVARLGGRAAFCGKVGKDAHGEMYEATLNKECICAQLHKCPVSATGHTITFITPDKERTFATHLGASINLKKSDFVDNDLRNSKILHIEGYQLELPEVKDLIYHAANIAKQNNIKISIDLSDAALIRRNLADFKHFVKNYADIVFANETEAKAFTGLDEESALHEIAKHCEIACLKLGEKGSLIMADGKVIKIPAFKVKTVSATGAGDMYAAGILYGITHNLPLEKAGNLASYAAAQIVSQLPARLMKKLSNKVPLEE